MSGARLWARLLAAPTLWALAFVVFYAVQATACVKGMPEGTLRWLLAGLFLATLLGLAALLYQGLRRRPAGKRLPASLIPALDALSLLAALGSFAMVLFLPPC